MSTRERELTRIHERITEPIPPSAPELEPVRIEAWAGQRLIRRTFISRGQVVVGSSGGADLVVEDPTVSRRHLELRAHPGGLLVKDLGSTNGTRYQGSLVKEALVPVGSALLLGAVELRILPARPALRAQLGSLVSANPAMAAALEAMNRVAPMALPVVLEGETGTGKQVAARALHAASGRAGGFNVLSCVDLAGPAARAQLFGSGGEPGILERSHGGTLLLDDVGELPLETQAQLLRVLESRVVTRPGEAVERPADVRFLATSQHDLAHLVEKGRFRQDLFHRLAVVRIRLPALRERPEDIPHLIRTLLDELGPSATGLTLSAEVQRALEAHGWPGNVRELRNVLARAVGTGAFDLRALGLGGSPPLDYRAARKQALETFEREFVRRALRAGGRNVARAAREVGIDRVYLHKLISKHAIDCR